MGRRGAALLLTLALLLTGCAGKQGTVLLREWPDEDGGGQAQSGDGGGFRVGMVADVGGVEDQSFNQSAWEGLQSLRKDTGVFVSYLTSQSGEDYDHNFDLLAVNRYSLCWGIGFAMDQAVLNASKKYPATCFAIVDSTYENIPHNVAAVTFRAQEPSFLVGYVAGMTTETGRVGYVGGVASPSILAFEYGYRAGVAYAAQARHREIGIDAVYVDSFTDDILGREAALEMYGGGCDVIYQVAGGAGLGVIQAAVETGKLVIGVDRDQAYLAPDNVLTSALKDVGAAVEQVSKTFLSGQDIGGREMSFGLAEGAMGIPVGHPNYSDQVYDRTLEVRDDIVAGILRVPETQEELDSFLAELSKQR